MSLITNLVREAVQAFSETNKKDLLHNAEESDAVTKNLDVVTMISVVFMK